MLRCPAQQPECNGTPTPAGRGGNPTRNHTLRRTSRGDNRHHPHILTACSSEQRLHTRPASFLGTCHSDFSPRVSGVNYVFSPAVAGLSDHSKLICSLGGKTRILIVLGVIQATFDRPQRKTFSLRGVAAISDKRIPQLGFLDPREI